MAGLLDFAARFGTEERCIEHSCGARPCTATARQSLRRSGVVLPSGLRRALRILGEQAAERRFRTFRPSPRTRISTHGSHSLRRPRQRPIRGHPVAPTACPLGSKSINSGGT